MPEPSLEFIQSMLQRSLDSLGRLREDVSNLRRRVGRVEHAINNIPRDLVDRTEGEILRQDEVDRTNERLQALEAHP